MKKKRKTRKIRKKNEFRYHDVFVKRKKGKAKNIQHPTYVFLQKGNSFVYVSITHSPIVRGAHVIRLRKNPNEKDNRPSYRVSEIRQDYMGNFSKAKKGWEIDPDDEKDIREDYKNNISNEKK